MIAGRLWVAEANNYPDKKAGKNDRIINPRGY